MPPPGRRRPSTPQLRLLPILFAVLVFLSPSVLAANAVLGLDLGTEYIKAALVKPGIPMEIVLTKDSKRKETSAVAFKPLPQGSESDEYPERLYGGDALGLAPRFPTDVYPNLKHLLGVSPPMRDDAIARYRQRYPGLDLRDDAANGTVVFHSKTFPAGKPEGVGSFSVEELLGMELKAIRENAEAMAKSDVRDVVIAIPAFYTADERRAVEFAAELAGFKLMGLVSDGLAVGLNYATSRTFGVIDDGEKPEYHLVYDMGAGSTTATLLRMQGRKIKDAAKRNKTVQEVGVVSLGWDRSLGGDALNDMIVNDMVKKFAASSGAKAAGITEQGVRQHGRAMAKMWRESERLRQVLSANTATSGFFESLLEDVDYRYKLSRSEFEAMAASISPRIGQPIETALANGKLAMTDLTSVILHGGTVRTPFIQSLLETRVGDPAKLRGNVNADEAAVFGAAFKAAGLSPSFKVKEINAQDVAGYGTVVQWTSNGKPRSQQVFMPTSQVGPVKQMPFKFLDDFRFSISQKVPNVASGALIDRPIVEVLTTNLTSSVGELVSTYHCGRENISTLVYLRLDPASGLPEVTKSTVSCESTVMEKKSGVMDGVKGIFGFGKKEDKPLEDDDDVEELEPLPDLSSETSSTTSSSSKKATSSSSTASSSKGSKNADKKTVATKKMQVTNIKFDQRRSGILQPPEAEVRRIKDGLAAFDRSDQGRRLREELFNGLEAFTYRVRDMLTESSFIEASNVTQRTDIEALLGTTSDWLHGEGVSAGMEILKDKLQALKALVDPITTRKDESKKRPKAVARVTEILEITRKQVEKVKKHVEQASSSAAARAASETSTTATSEVEEETTSVSTPPEAESSEDISAAESDTAEADAAQSDTTETDATQTDATESSTSSSSITSAPKPKFTPYDPFEFTDIDLKRIQGAYDSASEWLLETIEKQQALGPDEDPVLLSSDLDAVAEQLKRVCEEMARKEKSKASASSSASSSRSAKSSISKSRASASSASSKSKAEAAASSAATATESGAEAETTAAESSAAPTETPAGDEQAKTHDEL